MWDTMMNGSIPINQFLASLEKNLNIHLDYNQKEILKNNLSNDLDFVTINTLRKFMNEADLLENIKNKLIKSMNLANISAEQVFNKLDIHHQGIIQSSIFLTNLQAALKISLTNDEAFHLEQILDINKDASISKYEFLKFMNANRYVMPDM